MIYRQCQFRHDSLLRSEDFFEKKHSPQVMLWINFFHYLQMRHKMRIWLVNQQSVAGCFIQPHPLTYSIFVSVHPPILPMALQDQLVLQLGPGRNSGGRAPRLGKYKALLSLHWLCGLGFPPLVRPGCKTDQAQLIIQNRAGSLGQVE